MNLNRVDGTNRYRLLLSFAQAALFILTRVNLSEFDTRPNLYQLFRSLHFDLHGKVQPVSFSKRYCSCIFRYCTMSMHCTSREVEASSKTKVNANQSK